MSILLHKSQHSEGHDYELPKRIFRYQRFWNMEKSADSAGRKWVEGSTFRFWEERQAYENYEKQNFKTFYEICKHRDRISKQFQNVLIDDIYMASSCGACVGWLFQDSAFSEFDKLDASSPKDFDEANCPLFLCILRNTV